MKMASKPKKRLRASQMVPEERRQQLLRAGVACFACKGIGGTKHADISRACGVSVPAVFSYFPNRSELVRAILEGVGTQIRANVIDAAQLLTNPAEQLAATAPLFADYAAKEPDYVKVWLMWSMHFAPEIQEHFRRFESSLVDALAEMIRAGATEQDPDQDIHDRARVIVGSSAFLAKMVFDGVSEKRRQQFVEHVLQSTLFD
jgi:AcrR family transcriptional regulator